MSETIPLFDLDITNDDEEAVARVLRQRKLGLGESVREFEAAFEAKISRPYAIGVGSLGTGLRIALTACGIGPGHEVLLPAFAPVVLANAVVFSGAKPVFVDVDPRTLTMDPAAVEPLVTERSRAVLAHVCFGNGTMLEGLARLCRKFEIAMIEHSTEALGARVGRDLAGRFGRLSVFGLPHGGPFAGPVCGGDAAVIATHDDTLADACRSLRDAGRPYIDPEDGSPLVMGRILEHERIGFDSRMDDLRAALALSQLARLDRTLERRRAIAEEYVRRLGGIADLILPTLPEPSGASWSGFVVRLAEVFGIDDRDLIIRGLHRHEIGASNPYPVAPLLPFHACKWGSRPGEFPVAERMAQRTIALPFHHALTSRDIELVCQTLELMLRRQAFRRS